jgi:DNA-binding CsgD family transcriptional regulator
MTDEVGLDTHKTMNATTTRHDSSSAMVDLLLSALGETRVTLGLAFYRYEATGRVLTLDGYFTSSAMEASLLAASGPYALGATSAIARSARGLVPEYVARNDAETAWLSGAPMPLSAYFAPVSRDEALLGVLVFFRRGDDSISEPLRPLLDLVAHLVTKGEIAAQAERERARGIEACLGRFSAEMGRLGFGASRTPLRTGETPLDTSVMTPREQEVLQIFLRHGEIGAIAERLAISPHTVRNHLKAIYRKLGVHSQAELLRRLQFEPSSEAQ